MLKNVLIIFFILLSLNSYSQDSVIKSFINEWIGKPYRFGGETKKGIDCSALVQKFYKNVYNTLIPRTCKYIYNFESLRKVEFTDIKIGDILLFSSRLSPSGWHTGIYIGNDNFLHAANYRDGVKISCISDSVYIKSLKGVRRL